MTSDNSADPVVQKKAWYYVNYFLASSKWDCDRMLDALSRTNFASSVDFSAFKRNHRAKHLPSNKDNSGWTTIYRYVDDDGRVCLVRLSALKKDTIY